MIFKKAYLMEGTDTGWARTSSTMRHMRDGSLTDCSNRASEGSAGGEGGNTLSRGEEEGGGSGETHL